MKDKRTKEQKKDDLYWAMKNKEISIKQFHAQMKDIGYEDWEIEIYIDGDTSEFD